MLDAIAFLSEPYLLLLIERNIYIHHWRRRLGIATGQRAASEEGSQRGGQPARRVASAEGSQHGGQPARRGS